MRCTWVLMIPLLWSEVCLLFFIFWFWHGDVEVCSFCSFFGMAISMGTYPSSTCPFLRGGDGLVWALEAGCSPFGAGVLEEECSWEEVFVGEFSCEVVFCGEVEHAFFSLWVDLVFGLLESGYSPFGVGVLEEECSWEEVIVGEFSCDVVFCGEVEASSGFFGLSKADAFSGFLQSSSFSQWIL